jgi:hypothetical protein
MIKVFIGLIFVSLFAGVPMAQSDAYSTAISMQKQGWSYTLPVPKSRQAAWGNYDRRTTWWYGYWYNSQTGFYSQTTPRLNASGLWIGDYQNFRGYWRNGGSPPAPTRLEQLMLNR